MRPMMHVHPAASANPGQFAFSPFSGTFLIGVHAMKIFV
jgi:hypothetical protein